MYVLAGSFGLKGTAHINRDNQLVLNAAGQHIYKPEQIVSASSSVYKEKKFGCLGFLIGAILLSAILSFIFGLTFILLIGHQLIGVELAILLGIVLGVVLAIAGSFHTKTYNVMDLTFDDNKTVQLHCTHKEVRQLAALTNA